MDDRILLCLSGLDDSLADGIAYQLGARVQVELVHDVLAVPLDGLGTDDQRGGDLVVAGALSQVGQYLSLTLGQAVQVNRLVGRALLL